MSKFSNARYANRCGTSRLRCERCSDETKAPGEFQSKRGAFLEEQSELAEKILDQVADAVICTDHSGTIIRWNHASTALFGYSAEEALGQSVELIIPDDLRAAHWTGFDAAMTKGAHEAARSGQFHTPDP